MNASCPGTLDAARERSRFRHREGTRIPQEQGITRRDPARAETKKFDKAREREIAALETVSRRLEKPQRTWTGAIIPVGRRLAGALLSAIMAAKTARK